MDPPQKSAAENFYRKLRPKAAFCLNLKFSNGTGTFKLQRQFQNTLISESYEVEFQIKERLKL